MKNSLDTLLKSRLMAWHAQHLHREHQARENMSTQTSRYHHEDYLVFTHNDYLGLSSHPAVCQATQQAIEKYGIGSTAAHAVGGHCAVHDELEQALAQWTGRPAAIVFSTGYMANMGIISTLMDKKNKVFADRLVHASILDGIHLSGASLIRYHHLNVAHLQTKLKRYPNSPSLIVTDGVFSMEGDITPLPELAHCAQTHDAWLMVDDAHGMGVLGATGAGCVEHFGLSLQEVPILMGTLSKAFGCFGAFVCGSEILIDSLRQWSRSYLFTTALPPLLAQSALTSLHLIQTESWRREHLQDLIHYFKTQAATHDIPLMPSTTPIQPILIGDNQKVMDIQHHLREQNILVAAIRPPTVPLNTARLRVSLNAHHTYADINKLITALKHFFH